MNLAPVPEPSGIGFVARVRNPGYLITTGFAWLGLAVPPEQLIPAFGKKPMPFDVHASLDVVAMVDTASPPAVHFAYSLPIRSVDEMKDALASRVTWRPLPNGAFAMEMEEDSKTPGTHGGLAGMECAISPSAGDAAARFICAEGNSLDALLPYLTLTLPRTTSDHDISVELRPNLSGLWATQRRSSVSDALSNAVSNGAALLPLLDAVSADTAAFAAELHGVALSMDVDARGARIEMHITTKKGASTLSRIVLTPASGPPDAFLRLPSDVDFALFGAGTPQDVLEGIRANGAPLLAKLLERPTLSKEGVAPLVGAVFDAASAPWVAGVSMGAPSDAQAAKTKKVWFVGAVQTPYDHVAEIARRFASSKQSKPPPKAPAGFADDGMALEVTVPVPTPHEASKKGAPQNLKLVLHVLIQRKGPWTWIVASPDDSVAIDLLEAVTSDGKPALADRPDAAWFRGHSLTDGADLALKANIDPTLLADVLGGVAKSVTLPPPAPLLVSTQVSAGTGRDGDDDLIIRVDAPASITAGIFFAIFKDAITTHAGSP